MYFISSVTSPANCCAWNFTCRNTCPSA